MEDVVQILQENAIFQKEVRNLESLVGYTLAEDIFANEDIPFTDRASVDGYAVCAEDTVASSVLNPAYLEYKGSIGVNEVFTGHVTNGTCVAVATGSVMPEGATAVVMQEYTQKLGEDTVVIQKAVFPRENCMLQGEDAKRGTCTLSKGTHIRPQEIAQLATLGITSALVWKKPRVAIFSTGDEILEPQEPVQTGYVRDANSYALHAWLTSLGVLVERLPIVRDNVEELYMTMRYALSEADIVVLSGGSSIGTRDYTLKAIERIENATILTHGIALNPGKPTVIAKVETNMARKMIFGLPGQVASAQIVARALLIPFIQYCAGNMCAFERTTWDKKQYILAQRIPSNIGKETWVRVVRKNSEEVVPLFGKSGLLRTLVDCNGVVIIPPTHEGIEENSIVEVYAL